MNAYRIVTRIQDQDDFAGVPQSGQVVVYNSAQAKFVPSDVANVLPPNTRTLAGLQDVQVTSPAATDLLVYSAVDQKWVNDHIVDGGNW